MQGWRFVFLVMSSLALTVTVLVLVFGVEPRNLRARGASNPQRGAWGTGAAAVLAGVRAMVRDSDFASVDGPSQIDGHVSCRVDNSCLTAI